MLRHILCLIFQENCFSSYILLTDQVYIAWLFKYVILVNADSFLLKCSRCSWMFSNVYGNECSRTFATEAARYSIKKLFWKIHQNEPDNHIRYGLFFITFQWSSHKIYQNRDFCSAAFLLILRGKSRHFFEENLRATVCDSFSIGYFCVLSKNKIKYFIYKSWKDSTPVSVTQLSEAVPESIF